MIRYWMGRRPEDREEFQRRAPVVCSLYKQAATLHEQGVHLVSSDEKTGIQALERLGPILRPVPGHVEKQESHYRRHGTCCLIANLEVATGRIIQPTLGPSRSEADFADHVARTVDTDPDANWIFITDNLDTHKSESLVRQIADRCNLPEDLGKKGRRGILKSTATRGAFLEDPTHRIRFVYTPKHASWLNQIELWFSILVRRLLRRGSFTSLDELQQRLLAFIEYFNRTLAKPFKWTYAGRPLTV